MIDLEKKPKQRTYYVAVCYDYGTPQIVEEFNDRADARQYAEILRRAKGRKYIVLCKLI